MFQLLQKIIDFSSFHGFGIRNSKNLIKFSTALFSKLIKEFRDNTTNDVDMQLLRNTVMQGWPAERNKVPEAETIRPHFSFYREIVCCDGLLFQGNQLVLPKAMQAEMLSSIDESH